VSVGSRKARGAQTQRAVAAYLAANGWPWATDAGAGRTGSDILNVPGLEWEVKARADYAPAAWLRQAALNRHGGVPLVTHRVNGQGLLSVASWPTIMRLEDAVRILRLAGYGDAFTDVMARSQVGP
jgi:hypothetical protein